MNLSGGFKALGQGLQLISEQNFRREERDWMAMREENLLRLRHDQGMELEGARAENQRQEGDADRRWRTTEAAKQRRADDQRQNRADTRADARLSAELRARQGEGGTNAAQLRRLMSEGIGKFRVEMRELEDSITKATEAGNEQGVARMTAQLQGLQQERNEFYLQYASLLSKEGDPIYAGMSEEDLMASMGGGSEADAGAEPGAQDGGQPRRPSTATAASPARKPKPMQREQPVSAGGTRGGRSLTDRLKQLDAQIAALPKVPIPAGMSAEDYSAAREQNERRNALIEERKKLVRQDRPSFGESLRDTYNKGLIGP